MARTIGSASGEVLEHLGINLGLPSEYRIVTPRPLAGEPAKAERRYAHGIPRWCQYFTFFLPIKSHILNGNGVW